MAAKLTPELDVDALDLDGIRLMLQEAVGPGKRFRVEISTDGAEQKKAGFIMRPASLFDVFTPPGVKLQSEPVAAN